MSEAHRDDPISLVGYDAGQEEVAAIRGVISSGFLTNGPQTAAFEAAFAARHRVEHAVALANGTLALAGIYLALGIGPGDEVIVPSMTFISTATSVQHVGAQPVFAEIEPVTFMLDPADVARRMTSRTRAIVVVHYGGQPGPMVELQSLAASRGVALIEDAAEAHGAEYRGEPVGGFGVAAMFSFTPTKNITTGEGGMVTTNDRELADKLRLLRNHGQTAPYVHSLLGFNWRMTEMQAAMGLVQLGRLEAILERKRANAHRIDALLADFAGVRGPARASDRTHTYMLYTLIVERGRDAILAALNGAGIAARQYFPPVHQQPIYAELGVKLPVTEGIASRMLSLPFHSKLTDAQLIRMASALRDAVASV